MSSQEYFMPQIVAITIAKTAMLFFKAEKQQ